MKKLLFFLLLIAILCGVLVATCPDREKHLEAVSGVVSNVVNKEMDESGIDGKLASIGTMVAVSAVDKYLKSNLIIRDHTIYSIGVINYEDEFRMVSVGVLNHVFTISEDDARQLLKDKLTLPNLGIK